MESLQIESFLKLVEDMNIFELLTFLRENKKIENMVLVLPDFWTSFLKQNVFEHKKLLLSRGDLHTGEQWKQFFIDLVKGTSYYYTCFFKESTNSTAIGPTYTVRPRYSFPDNEVVILGSLPSPGTSTLHVSFPYLYHTENMFFFGKTKHDLIVRALNWIMFETDYEWRKEEVETFVFFPSTHLEVRAFETGMDIFVELEEAFEKIANKLENVDISQLTMRITTFGINIDEEIYFKGIFSFPAPLDI